MYFRRLAAALAVALALAGCGKKQAAWERLAILPFENLAGDPALEWAGRAVAEGLSLHLAGAPRVHAFRVGSLRETPGGRATQVLHGYLRRAGERLQAETVLEDAASGRTVKTFSVRGEALTPLARELAVGLGWPARAYGASQDAAVRAYVTGLSTSEPRAAAEAFQGAVTLEPDFGAAHLAWAQRLAGGGDIAGARQVLARAGERGERIPVLERARLAVLAATLTGDPAAQRRALESLAQAAPAEAEVFGRLGELEMNLSEYRDAVRSYERAAERDPAHPVWFNQLGYACSYARDLAGAVRSLERYQALRPEEANPLDSLGDVHYHAGRFAEAENYYLAAWGKDPGFLGGGEPCKAAWARLMQGNRKGADELFEKYLEGRRDAPAELHRAQWEYLTGRRQQAVKRIEGQASVAAWVQLAVWKLEAGERAGARECAARAMAASRAAPPPLVRMVQFLAAEPANAAEWAARAQRAFPAATDAFIRRAALAHALLLAREYAAALPLLREMHATTPATANQPTNILLAWALIETGRRNELGDLLDWFPAPQPGGEQPFACLSFPRLLQLRQLQQAGPKPVPAR